MALYGNGPGGTNYNQYSQQPATQGGYQGFGSSSNFQTSGFPMQNGAMNQMSGPGQWPPQQQGQGQQQQQQNWFKQQYPQGTPQNQVQHFTPNSNHPPGNQFMNNSFGGYPQQPQNFPTASYNHPQQQFQTSNVPMTQSTPNPFFNQNLPQQFSNLNVRPNPHPQTSMGGNLWSN